METVYRYSLTGIFISAVIVFILLFFVSAPYGKFLRKGWGPVIRSKWAWALMEFPSPALMVFFFLVSGEKNIMRIIFLLFWLSHYFHLTFIYPFIQPGRNKSYPLLLVLMAFIFNCLNGSVNGYGVFHLLKYDMSWIYSWQFLSGALLFIAGFAINKSAHMIFNRIREGNPEGYIVPKGGLFNYVSCPHYLGEIIEWGGWALMTWSLPGLSFFVFTIANLLPRALSSHKWYREEFAEYPSGRKALIPFLL